MYSSHTEDRLMENIDIKCKLLIFDVSAPFVILENEYTFIKSMPFMFQETKNTYSDTYIYLNFIYLKVDNMIIHIVAFRSNLSYMSE